MKQKRKGNVDQDANVHSVCVCFKIDELGRELCTRFEKQGDFLLEEVIV